MLGQYKLSHDQKARLKNDFQDIELDSEIRDSII
jgi:hypothetical protein